VSASGGGVASSGTDESGGRGPGSPGVVDVIVLAGGRGGRLGGVSKAEVVLAGRSLLDRALDAAAGARSVVVVGPPGLARPGLTTALEDPPLGGPVAGIDAGLRELERRAAGEPPDSRVLVLACDVPLAAPAVPGLHAALDEHPDADGAHLVRDGHPQLVAVHRAASLRRALDALAAEGGVRGASVRRLLDLLRMVPVADAANRSADADTWDDVARLESVLAEGKP
jgi:molybdopterin-guanine dinucleotide biosynthesis protein A